jgi:hypothetical protein
MSRRVTAYFAVAQVVTVAGLVALATSPVCAGDTGAVIAIPSRPGVPIVINGRDASYAVVEGDWGLARPGAVPVTVFGDAPIRPNSVYEPRRSYHPRYGHAPPRGRNEVDQPSSSPGPAESFSRSWSSSSSDVQAPAESRGRQQPSVSSSGSDTPPATITDPETFYQPDIVVSPSDRRRRRH